ncbi:MAG: sulfite exporter TauE/SafE family protein [Bacteroidota bacterium]
MGLGIGLLTGFINTLAGGGSLLTLPFLIFLGLEAPVANGTNRIGIFFQTLVGGIVLRRKTKMSLSGSGIYLIPAITAAIVGALLAVKIDDEQMKIIIGVVMAFMLIPILMNRDKWLATESRPSARNRRPLLVVVFLALGFYGGFIQAGIGVFLISALVLIANYTLTHANVLKNLIIAAYTLPAIVVFLVNDQVHWPFGILLMSGQVTGSWVAAKFAGESKHAPKVIRWLLIIMVAAGAVKMFIG